MGSPMVGRVRRLLASFHARQGAAREEPVSFEAADLVKQWRGRARFDRDMRAAGKSVHGRLSRAGCRSDFRLIPPRFTENNIRHY
jgi:hypothetical protein